MIMVAVACIIAKKEIPARELLAKMLKKLSHRGHDRFGIYINGTAEETTILTELEGSGSAPVTVGTVGLGIGAGAGNNHREVILNTNLTIGSKNGHFILDSEVDRDEFCDLFETCPGNSNIQDYVKGQIKTAPCGFAFAGVVDNKLVLARDIIGRKPLFWGENDNYLAGASEKKALWELGIMDNIRPVQPGECILLSRENVVSYDYRGSLSNKIPMCLSLSFDDCVKKLEELLKFSIRNRIKNNEAALLFSGGLDSSILANVLKHLDVDVHLFCACFKNRKDHINSTKAANLLGLPLEVYELTDDEIWAELNNLVYHLETADTVTAEIATPIYFATRLAKKFGFNSIFTGQGADELFAGYSRYENILHKDGYDKLHNALTGDVLELWQKNVQRDDNISMANSVGLILPYLASRVVEFCLPMPPEYKLKKVGNQYVRKYILRTLGKGLKLDNDILDQPKVAVQYGSGTTQCFRRLAGRLGMDANAVRSYGFRSANEVLMNLVAYRLGFPEGEVRNIEIVQKILNDHPQLSRI